jgi:hypothetical protein
MEPRALYLTSNVLISFLSGWGMRHIAVQVEVTYYYARHGHPVTMLNWAYAFLHIQGHHHNWRQNYTKSAIRRRRGLRRRSSRMEVLHPGTQQVWIVDGLRLVSCNPHKVFGQREVTSLIMVDALEGGIIATSDIGRFMQRRLEVPILRRGGFSRGLWPRTLSAA